MKGLVVKTTGLWYEILAKGERKIARLRGKFKLEGKKITNPIAIGDWVEIESKTENEWIITKILARQNYLVRQSPRKKGFDHMIAANVDQALIFFTFKMPRTSVGFLDRVLISLETFRIPGIIFLNKSDLCSQEELDTWNEMAKTYESNGYTCLQGALTQNKIPFDDILRKKSTLLVGHSGTGKSTLINQIIPEASQEVSQISNFANKGIHTTTFAEMFFIDDSSKIIDTPGIKELSLAEIRNEELAHYFSEMRVHLGFCKFHNCLHVEEPGCIIKKKVEKGEIAPFRYKSYLSMLSSDDNRK